MTPTPGAVAYVAYWRVLAEAVPSIEARWDLASSLHRAAWEAAAQAVQPCLTPWERGWLLDRLSPLPDAEREIWCLLLEKYWGDHALARAIYDRTPLEEETHD